MTRKAKRGRRVVERREARYRRGRVWALVEIVSRVPVLRCASCRRKILDEHSSLCAKCRAERAAAPRRLSALDVAERGRAIRAAWGRR